MQNPNRMHCVCSNTHMIPRNCTGNHAVLRARKSAIMHNKRVREHSGEERQSLFRVGDCRGECKKVDGANVRRGETLGGVDLGSGKAAIDSQLETPPISA